MTLFEEVVEKIGRAAPFQRKKLQAFISRQPAEFQDEANRFMEQYQAYLRGEGLTMDDAVKAYVKFCTDLLRYHVRFLQTRRYPTAEATTAYDVMYNDPAAMKPYMIGLAMSLFLWPSHYEMYRAFGVYMREQGSRIASYLEIGPGHGAYLAKALEFLGTKVPVAAIDISETSLAISRSILDFLHPARATQVEFSLLDVLKFDTATRFDFITMGEVLEHVNAPEKLLCKIRDLMTPDGRAFVTTCANAPTIDHVYHFHNVGEIREMIGACGLFIEDERVLPAEDVSLAEAEAQLITVNYSALVRRSIT